MRFQRNGDDESMSINLTPMIDCIFLLIIFFLVTASIVPLEQDLSIELPVHSRRLQVKKPPAPPIVVNVRLLPRGRAEYRVDNETMSLAALAVNLSRARIHNRDCAVVIRGDRNVRWEHVAAVMSRCAQAGITNVSATVEIRETR